jgi:hypothetical protein
MTVILEFTALLSTSQHSVLQMKVLLNCWSKIYLYFGVQKWFHIMAITGVKENLCCAKCWSPRWFLVMLDSEFQDRSMLHSMLRSVLHQIRDSRYPCCTELWIQARANVNSYYTKFWAERWIRLSLFLTKFRAERWIRLSLFLTTTIWFGPCPLPKFSKTTSVIQSDFQCF